MKRLDRYSLAGLEMRGGNVVRANMGEVVTRHLAARELAVSEVLRFKAPGPWITRELRDCVQASDYDALLADRDRLAAELAARDSTDLCVRLMKANNELSDQVVDLQSELSAARADAERVEYCVRNALALDFAYGEDGRCAVVIEIPKDARYSIGFRDIIDTARAALSAEAERRDCKPINADGIEAMAREHGVFVRRDGDTVYVNGQIQAGQNAD